MTGGAFGVVYSLGPSPCSLPGWAGTERIIHVRRDDGNNWQDVTFLPTDVRGARYRKLSRHFDANCYDRSPPSDRATQTVYLSPHNGGRPGETSRREFPTAPSHSGKESRKPEVCFKLHELRVYVSFNNGGAMAALQNNMP